MKRIDEIDNNFDLEQNMIHHLILRSSCMNNCGLLHGKMGIALFFYHYAQYIGNVVYSDFADDLLDDIWENAHKELPVTFASGLTGIAWGIAYLLQNGFAGGMDNEICEDLDVNIMRLDIRRFNDEFIENELEGLLHYILIRITGSIKQQTNLPFDELYRNDLAQALNLIQKNKKITKSSREMIDQFLNFTFNNRSLNYESDLLPFIDESEINKEDIISSPLGLKDGLAGHLYKQLIWQQK